MVEGSMPHAEILYLYSSNIRPLYEQDILDLLAAPRGTLYRFRYLGTKYLSPGLLEKDQAVLRQSLVSQRSVVHFALQQEAQYHQAAFIPVREGAVRRVESVGDIKVIEFELGAYLALKKPAPKQEGTREDPAGRQVRDYADWLAKHNVPRPYDSWAGTGPDATIESTLMHDDKDEQVLFDQTAWYLSRTESFRGARFLRVRRIYRLGSEHSIGEAIEAVDGTFTLEAGATYGIEVIHSQPSDVHSREVFDVSADNALLRVVGKPTLEIASRYDVLTLPVHAVDLPTNERRETVLTIQPSIGIKGPRVELRLRVVRPAYRTATAVGGSAATALLLGLPTLLPGLPIEIKVFCVFLAAALGALLVNFGLRRT